jgi:hypothetical protein
VNRGDDWGRGMWTRWRGGGGQSAAVALTLDQRNEKPGASGSRL